jgi:hypothetical protein
MHRASDHKAGGDRWEEIANTGRTGFRGGPGVALSTDGGVLVTGGGGLIIPLNVPTRQRIPPVFFSLEGDLDVTPSMTGADNGRTLAYAWQNHLRVVELVGDSWAQKGVLPEIEFDIDSVSFSSDGRLAVGQPGGNLVAIFEVFNF